MHIYLLHLLPGLVLLLVHAGQEVILPLQFPTEETLYWQCFENLLLPDVVDSLLDIPHGLGEVLIHQRRPNQLEHLGLVPSQIQLLLDLETKMQLNICIKKE